MISRCPPSGYVETQRQLISCKDNLFSHNTQILLKYSNRGNSPHPHSADDNWSDCTQICLNIIRSSWPVRKAVPRLLIGKGNYSPCLGKKGKKKHRTRSCELELKNSIVESGSWSSNVIKEFSIECHKKEANQGCHWVITTIWRKNLVTEQRSSVLKLILILSVNLVKLEKKACCVCVPD